MNTFKSWKALRARRPQFTWISSLPRCSRKTVSTWNPLFSFQSFGSWTSWFSRFSRCGSIFKGFTWISFIPFGSWSTRCTNRSCRSWYGPAGGPQRAVHPHQPHVSRTAWKSWDPRVSIITCVSNFQLLGKTFRTRISHHALWTLLTNQTRQTRVAWDSQDSSLSDPAGCPRKSPRSRKSHNPFLPFDSGE